MVFRKFCTVWMGIDTMSKGEGPKGGVGGGRERGGERERE